MFPSSVIRKLANSEEMLAETENFVGLAAHVKGPVDIEAMSAAYDALLESRPVLTARLERGSDGRHQIVVEVPRMGGGSDGGGGGVSLVVALTVAVAWQWRLWLR